MVTQISAIKNRLSGKRKRRWGEQLIGGVLFLCAFLSVGTTAAIIWILLREAWGFFQEAGGGDDGVMVEDADPFFSHRARED